MITGIVREDVARIRLKVRGSRGREREVETVVDTGFTGDLTLPPSVIGALGLRWQSLDRGTLADGSECLFDVFEAKVVWDRRTRRILVTEADADPLVGMSLLSGYELNLEVRHRGKVRIVKLP